MKIFVLPVFRAKIRFSSTLTYRNRKTKLLFGFCGKFYIGNESLRTISEQIFKFSMKNAQKMTKSLITPYRKMHVKQKIDDISLRVLVARIHFRG